MTNAHAPAIRYWRLYVDADGVSRQTLGCLTNFEMTPIQPQAAPQWIGAKTTETMTTFVTVLPVGWIGDWHENPKPQWIIPLSGRWFVESMDGHRVVMGAGDLSLGQDQNTRARGGKQGHLSGTVGDEPAVLMLVQLTSPHQLV